MTKLLFTENIPFDMTDWADRNDIAEVFAGNSCIMARTEDGSVLRKCNAEGSVINTCDLGSHIQAGSFTSADPELKGWKDLKHISVSWDLPGLALGARQDGTVAALLPSGRIGGSDPFAVAKAVSGWRDVVEVAAAGDLFALTKSGTLRSWVFPGQTGASAFSSAPGWYERSKDFSFVNHIRGGMQSICVLSGMTGRVSYICDSELEKHGIRHVYDGVIDLIETGSDTEELLLVTCEHELKVVQGSDERVLAHGVEKVVGELYCVLALTTERTLIPVFRNHPQTAEALEWKGIMNAAVGFSGWHPDTAYVIAVADDR